MTYANVEAQIHSLVKAWEWSEKDKILHVLPLHHTHVKDGARLTRLGIGELFTVSLDRGSCMRIFGSFKCTKCMESMDESSKRFNAFHGRSDSVR